LPKLRHLDLRFNLFTRVPRALLEAPADAEINLQDNPLPDEEIRAVRVLINQRRAAGQTVPQLILPPLPEDAGGLREAVANDMNVHTGVLTDAFKKQLNALAQQFPDHLIGSNDQQRQQMAEIQTRLTHALDEYALQHRPDATLLAKANDVASLMFQKGQGETQAYVNEFQQVEAGTDGDVFKGTAGHVLAYTFLALEAQWLRTPEPHQAEAQSNGMTALINALVSGSGMCDTRLCEEVLQTIGIPLTSYAQAHPEVVGIQAVQISADQIRDTVMTAAKQVLAALLDANSTLSSETPPAAWRPTLVAVMQKDHPAISAEAVEKQIQQITSEWEIFHDIVVEQRVAGQ
jgi:hypothetical protein